MEITNKYCGLGGLVTSDVIEIKNGESLLGFDFQDAENFGAGWLSTKNLNESSIFLHITPGLILLSSVDLSGSNVTVGSPQEESSTIPQPSSSSEKKKRRSRSSTRSTTSE